MTVLAICLIVLGIAASAFGGLRFAASRRQVLTPGEVPRGNGLPIMIAGDVALVVGVLLLVL